jgi:hypothetical protein
MNKQEAAPTETLADAEARLTQVKAELAQTEQRILANQIRSGLEEACERYGRFHDAKTAAQMLQTGGSVRKVGGGLRPCNGAGTPRRNASMDLMSLDDLAEEFAITHPYTVREDGSTPAGQALSSGSPAPSNYVVADYFGPRSSSKLANDLARSNFPLYQELRLRAVAAGLVVK